LQDEKCSKYRRIGLGKVKQTYVHPSQNEENPPNFTNCIVQ